MIIVTGEVSRSVDESLENSGIKQMHCAGSDLASYADKAEIVIVGDNAQIPPEFYENTGKVRVMAALVQGAETIDLHLATRAGIEVLAPNRGVSHSVADFLFARILQIARFEQKEGEAYELQGKTLGLLGWNDVSMQVSIRAKAFGMRVLVYDEQLTRGRAAAYDCELTDFIDLFVNSDFLSVHVPVQKELGNVIGKDILKLMKPEATLLSFADPEIFVWNELVRGLDWSYFRFLVMDLPLSYKDKAADFAENERAFVSVGRAAATIEAEESICREMIQEALKLARGETSRAILNTPRISERNRKVMNELLPFFDYIGQLSSARFQNKIPERVELLCEGQWPEIDEPPLLSAFLTGLARGFGATGVNNINAQMWAEEVGTEAYFMLGENHGAASIVARLYLEGKRYEIAGRVIGSQWQILGWDEYQFIAEPTKHLLILPHLNRPGMVGKVGSLLGERQINIGGMVLGHPPGNHNTALMWIRLDHAPGGDLLETLRETPDILNATYIYSPEVKGW